MSDRIGVREKNSAHSSDFSDYVAMTVSCDSILLVKVELDKGPCKIVFRMLTLKVRHYLPQIVCKEPGGQFKSYHDAHLRSHESSNSSTIL